MHDAASYIKILSVAQQCVLADLHASRATMQIVVNVVGRNRIANGMLLSGHRSRTNAALRQQNVPSSWPTSDVQFG